MATLKQINASRRNGAQSKGPITPEGKARASRNGTTHGIYSQFVVLHNEDPDLYNQSLASHLADWNPVTESEHNLVIDIVDARWRLCRYSRLESAAVDFEVRRMSAEVEEALGDAIDEGTLTVLGFNSLITSNRTFEVLQTAIRQQHRIIERATNQLRRFRKDRPDNDNGNSPETPARRAGGPSPAPATPAARSAEPVRSAAAAPADTKSSSQSRPAGADVPQTQNSGTEPGAALPVHPGTRTTVSGAGQHPAQTPSDRRGAVPLPPAAAA